MFVTFHTLEELPKGSQEIRQEYEENPTIELQNSYIEKVREFRKNFELPCWPYNDQDHMEHFKEFLRDLGVVYYDDGVLEDGEQNVAGPIYPFDSEYYKKLKSFKGFIHRVHLHRHTDDVDLLYTPMVWPYDNSQSGIILKDKILKDPIMSDQLAWSEMNSQTNVESIVYGGFIKYQKIPNESSVTNKFDTSRFSKKGKDIKQEKTDKGWIDVG